MDIHQWLAATADRADPHPSDDLHHMPEGLWAHPLPQGTEQRQGRSYRRKRRERASSDSSIIAPKVTGRSRAQAAARSLPSERARSAESAGRLSQESARSRSLRSASPTPARKVEKSYERRPRHKTRPDRYEHKRKKRTGDGDALRVKKPDKKRHKSQRSGDGGRTAGLVQSFQLKNRPHGSRLTIKPGATAGLFKHGRASTQVTGRAAGLPDLVFNEMKFLQRPGDRQDALPEVEEQQKQQSKRKDHKRPTDGEISNYFSAKRPALEPDRAHLDARHHRDLTTDGQHLPCARASKNHATPPVELPSKPFLGFGSRGVQLEANSLQSERTTFYTWSQTNGEPQATDRGQFGVPSHGTDHVSPARRRERHLGSARRGHRESSKSPNNGRQDRPQREAPERGRWIAARRGDDPALVEMYQPRTTNVDRRLGRRQSAPKYTSQPLPQQHEEQEAEDEPRQQQIEEHQMNDNYNTSDILKIHGQTMTSDSHQISKGYVPLAQPKANKENRVSESSFSIDGLLDGVRHLAATKIDSASQRKSTRALTTKIYDEEQAANSRYAVPVRGESLQTFADTGEGLLRSRRAEHLARPSQLLASPLYLQRHFEGMQPARASYRQASTGRKANFLLGQRSPEEDKEMLDNGDGDDPEWPLQEPVYSTINQAEQLAYGSGPRHVAGIYEAQSEPLESDQALQGEQYWSTPSNALHPHRVLSGDRFGFGSEQITRPASGHDGAGMGGFWKPNKLY